MLSKSATQIKVSIFLQRSASEKKSLYFFTYFYQEVLLKKVFIFLKIFLWGSATQIRVSIFLHIFWSRRDTEIKVTFVSKYFNQGALLILKVQCFLMIFSRSNTQISQYFVKIFVIKEHYQNLSLNDRHSSFIVELLKLILNIYPNIC